MVISVALTMLACEGTIEGAGPAASGPGGPGGPGQSSGAGGSGGTAAGSGGNHTSALNGEFSRLTRREYGATLREAFGADPDVSLIPVDGRVGPFTSNARVSPDPVHPYLLSGEDLALRIIPDSLPACEGDGAAVAECVAASYRGPLELLFRRPLAEPELGALSALIESLAAKGLSANEATRAMLTSAMLSPDFLFRTSPLAADDAAKARRIAEHVSYALWDAPPDADLIEASRVGAAELAAQAGRLSADSRAIPVLARFVAQWLDVDTDLRLEDPTFAESPRYVEFVRYVEDALTNDLPVTSLISGRRGFVHRDNIDAYGLETFEGSEDTDVEAVEWPADSPRRGVLGQDLIADSTRHPDASRRPIFRGLLVRRSLLCQEIPAPNPEFIAMAGEVGDRTTDERCATCHLRIDPIGRAFAGLDADGVEGGAAEVIDHDELGGSYADLAGLLEAVGSSRAFAECFARHWLGFFVEQPTADADTVWIAELADAVQAGASLGAVVEKTVMTLSARSEAANPWCQGP
jgi:hypothetical protein